MKAKAKMQTQTEKKAKMTEETANAGLDRGKKGSIEIKAKSEGLKSASCTIKTVPATGLPVVDGFINHEISVGGWLVSLPSTAKPLLLTEDSREELDKLQAAQLGTEISLKPKDWLIFYTEYQLPATITENGGSICFKNMAGRAEVYLNEELILDRKNSAQADAVIRLNKGLGKIRLNVRMQPDVRGHILLGDIVYVTPEKIKKTSGN